MGMTATKHKTRASDAPDDDDVEETEEEETTSKKGKSGPEVTPFVDAVDPTTGAARGRAAQVTAKAAAKAAASTNAGTSGAALTGQGGVVVAGTSGAALTSQPGVVINGDPLNISSLALPTGGKFSTLAALKADTGTGGVGDGKYVGAAFTAGQYATISDPANPRVFYKTAVWNAGVYA